MSALVPSAVDGDIPIGVLELLRGTRTGSEDAGDYGDFVTGFFGPNIRLHDEDDEPGDTPLPYLAVLWSDIDGGGGLGGIETGTSRVSLEVRLPRQAQRLPSIAVPAAPSVAAIAGGTTIAAGVYYCGYTAFTSAGESYGGPVSTVTLSAGQQIRWSSVPSGVRLWRSQVNRRDVRYLDTRSSSIYDDDHAGSYMGDALFPEQGLARNVVASVQRVLAKAKYVPDVLGNPLTDATCRQGRVARTSDRARNIKRFRWDVSWSVAFDTYEREAA